MRFHPFIALGLAVMCLCGDAGEGAPTTGRYMWVKCKPEDIKANCFTHMGPPVPLAGNSPRLPRSAVNDIFPVTIEETPPEVEEQSGEGSGNSIFPRDAPEPDNKNEEEGSTAVADGSGDVDYSNYVFPEKVHGLSTVDLKEENMIP